MQAAVPNPFPNHFVPGGHIRTRVFDFSLDTSHEGHPLFKHLHTIDAPGVCEAMLEMVFVDLI
eukprot:7458181-Karenia_brevis.AAC.1